METVADLLTAVPWALLVSLRLACSSFVLTFEQRARRHYCPPGQSTRLARRRTSARPCPGQNLQPPPLLSARPPTSACLGCSRSTARSARRGCLPTLARPLTDRQRRRVSSCSAHSRPAARLHTPLPLPPGGAPRHAPRLPLPGRGERPRSRTNSSALS